MENSVFDFKPSIDQYGLMYKLLGYTIVLSLFLWVGVIICADKSPKGYYLGPGTNGETCVIADSPWALDFPVFCGDIQSAYGALQALQGTVVKQPKVQEPASF